MVEHVLRRDSTFYRHDPVAELRLVQFKKDGFLLTVSTADITEIRFDSRAGRWQNVAKPGYRAWPGARRSPGGNPAVLTWRDVE
ncbi:MAG: hypothetical protein HUU20_03405 [Pirellulales bacterium]|nr:hypothetical protein [Pirellulales bacterium]